MEPVCNRRDIVDCQGGAIRSCMAVPCTTDDPTGHLGRVTVQYALERSSDVGAAKMALKLGNQRFYDEHSRLRLWGPFGDRAAQRDTGSAAEAAWVGRASILSLAIGQEIGVTPVQAGGRWSAPSPMAAPTCLRTFCSTRPTR